MDNQELILQIQQFNAINISLKARYNQKLEIIILNQKRDHLKMVDYFLVTHASISFVQSSYSLTNYRNVTYPIYTCAWYFGQPSCKVTMTESWYPTWKDREHFTKWIWFSTDLIFFSKPRELKEEMHLILKIKWKKSKENSDL